MKKVLIVSYYLNVLILFYEIIDLIYIKISPFYAYNNINMIIVCIINLMILSDKVSLPLYIILCFFQFIMITLTYTLFLTKNLDIENDYMYNRDIYHFTMILIINLISIVIISFVLLEIIKVNTQVNEELSIIVIDDEPLPMYQAQIELPVYTK